MTSAAAGKRAPTLIGQLSSKAQVTEKTLPQSVSTFGTGLEKPIAELKKTLPAILRLCYTTMCPPSLTTREIKICQEMNLSLVFTPD